MIRKIRKRPQIVDKVLEKLKQYESETPSKWREVAEFGGANKS